MRYSHLFGKTKKQIPKNETALNAQLLMRAGFVNKLMAGVYTQLPLGLRVIENIKAIVRQEMNNIGGQELLLPLLHPSNNWKQTGRWETYDTLFRFTSHFTKTDYALGPTHEEIVSPLAKEYIFSYQDLPLYIYQIQTKFRDEKRAKSGLLRGREFIMKDLYSFHTNEADLNIFYEKVQRAYMRVFQRVGLGDKTVLTFASGGTFAKFSHEFQTLSKSGEDTIFLCEKCMVAINKEIIHEQNTCPKCNSKKLVEKKGAEVGNIFKLGVRYSKPFNLTFTDAKGKVHDVVMGCYGIGITRLMGIIAEVHNDNKGLIWPASIAPFFVHLIGLDRTNAQVLKRTDEIYTELQKAGVYTLYDDRNTTPGEKFADSDLIGIPYRIVVSKRTKDKIEVKRRNEKTSTTLTLAQFLRSINKHRA